MSKPIKTLNRIRTLMTLYYFYKMLTTSDGQKKLDSIQQAIKENV